MDAKAFGKRLRALMESHDINQRDLSRVTGARPATVGEWYHGRSVPGWSYLGQIAEVLHVTIEELLGIAEGQEPPYEAWREFRQTHQGQSLNEEEVRALKLLAWPQGTEPTVASYQIALQALRSTETP